MKKLALAAVAAAFTATGVLAAEVDCRAKDTAEYAFCKDDATLVAAFHAELLASTDGALKEGLRNRLPRLDLSLAEQAARVRQLVLAGRLSPRTLALTNDVAALAKR